MTLAGMLDGDTNPSRTFVLPSRKGGPSRTCPVSQHNERNLHLVTR
jgi:hypothetical protein